MSDNKPKAPQFADDDWRSQVELHPDEDGYPRWDESGEGIWFKPDRETQCGNCGNKLEPDDRYCRMCGTKRGDGAYDPYLDTFDMEELYGSMPAERIYSCSKCGNCWISSQMGACHRYCPKCGNPASVSIFYGYL